MDFHERLKEARINAGLSQTQASEYLVSKGIDIKPYSVSRWESGSRTLGLDIFVILCECYKVRDIGYVLLGRKSTHLRADSLLDGLNRSGKAHALNYINLLKDDPLFTDEPIVHESRVYRLYNIPVSAGSGVYLDSDDYEEITADDLVPDETDYAVRVSGNSMEPKFYDGQILFIKEQQTLEEGEIGIFALNNESYVKRLVKNTLESLNPRYKPIVINESDDIRIFGKVIGAN